MLALRFLTGFIAVPVLVAAALDDGWLFRLALLATALLGTGEALWMARQAGYRPIDAFTYLLSFVIIFDAVNAPGHSVVVVDTVLAAVPVLGPTLGLIVLASLSVLLVRAKPSGALTDWALTLSLPFYVAGLLQFFAPLRYRSDTDPGLLAAPFPITWPLLVLLTSWTCDIAAYFAGRSLGRLRLAPTISPAKSVEGAVAGVLAAMMVGVLYSLLINVDPFRMAGFGLAVGLGSVIGDLAESFLKRQCGVKDSGFIMPGHGGILDRMDSLLFSAASAYFYLQAVL